MRSFARLFLSFILCIAISCTGPSETPEQQESKNQAIEKFSEAARLTDARENWAALEAVTQATEHYEAVTATDQEANKYLLYRLKAKLLNRERLYNLAAEAMDEALAHLEEYDVAKPKLNLQKEQVSTLRYKSTYLRRARKYKPSNDILFDLLTRGEVVKGMQAQLKNQIGLNYFDLFDYEKAYRQFDDILKISDLEPNMKAHYLQNRGNSAYRIGRKIQAFTDMSEAVGINESLDRPVYAFATRMDLGELYLRENDYQLAINNFDKAMASFSNINTDPDLYKIYNLRWSAAVALKLPGAHNNKDIYDSLQTRHQAQVQSYNAEQELATLNSRLDQYHYNQYQDALKQRYLPYWVAGAGLLLLSLSLILYSWMIRSRNNRVRAVLEN